MGIEFTLSDRQFPASPAFVRFLAQRLATGHPEREPWPDQISEGLWHAKPELARITRECAERVMRDRIGREHVARAYALFVALLTGNLDALATFHARYRFIAVIGIPRTGGSYLTAELYRALGIAPEAVPNALAHDSFPEAGPFHLTAENNSWVATLKTTAEYLTMVEAYFAGRRPHRGKIVVPKKLTQAVYAAGLFGSTFGHGFEGILTVRHPTRACVSTYEKSGGLPPDGRFIVRSNIEAWCRRDLEHLGAAAEEICSLDYFDAYLRYWEHYHLRVATDGLVQSAHLRIAAYGARRLQILAQHYHGLYGSDSYAAEFRESRTAKSLHPDWVARAQPSIERVARAWREAGLEFPAEEIADCV
jgi:hypothetical protein